MCRGGEERVKVNEAHRERREEAPPQVVDVKGGKHQDKTFYFFH